MTSPVQLDVSQYGFRDLVDVPAFARMLESFFQATGIPNGVVDVDGNLLSMSSGENACAVFHRVQPQAAERWIIEQRQRAHDAMLEMVAKGAKLVDILNAIVRQVESEDKTALCSVLLLDAEGKHLLTGAAPSLPAFYNDAIHGVEIGVGVGSCGTAAFLGQRVIVKDIQTHEYWKPYAQRRYFQLC